MGLFRRRKKFPPWAYEIGIFLIVVWVLVYTGSFFLGVWKQGFVRKQVIAANETCMKFYKGDQLFKVTIADGEYDVKEDGYMNELHFATLHWTHRRVLKMGKCIRVYLPERAKQWNRNHQRR